MREFLAQGPLSVAVQTMICLSACALFVAVLVDFALYSRRGPVHREKKSIVETGTMTLFFIVFYAILRSRVGVVPIDIGALRIALAILGTAMIAGGCVANIAGRFRLGRNWSNQIRMYQDQTLVRTGMYRIVRHPLYASIILMLYGGTLVYRNACAFAAVSLVFVPFMRFRSKQEEKLLLERFPEYRDYQKDTGMLFPKLPITLNKERS